MLQSCIQLTYATYLFNSFHLNGHTSGFHQETQELEPPRRT